MLIPGKWSKKKKLIKLQGGQFINYKNGTVKVSFQLTSCDSLVDPKSVKSDDSTDRPALPFQLFVQGNERAGLLFGKERQGIVLGFETEVELKIWEEAIRKHILPPPNK